MVPNERSLFINFEILDDPGVQKPGFHVVVKEFDPNSNQNLDDEPNTTDPMQIDETVDVNNNNSEPSPKSEEQFINATKEQINLILSQAPALSVEPEVNFIMQYVTIKDKTVPCS